MIWGCGAAGVSVGGMGLGVAVGGGIVEVAVGGIGEGVKDGEGNGVGVLVFKLANPLISA